MSTALPDYEGNYYSDSDKDESDHETPQGNPHQDDMTPSPDKASLPTTVNNHVAEHRSIPAEAKKPVRQSPHQRIQSTASNTSAALDDLIDGYGHDSQPGTPVSSTAPEIGSGSVKSVTAHSEPETKLALHHPVEGLAKDPPLAENSQSIDISPSPSTEMSNPTKTQSSIPNPAPPPKDGSASFLTDVLRVFDSKDEPALSKSTPALPPAPSTTTPPQDSAPKSPATTSPTTDGRSSSASNYWAQMRANLKAKRERAGSVTQDMSRTASHKTDDSTARSSNESSRSAKPNLPGASDGRSGSFTSYTPVPKFPEARQIRPTSPGLALGLPGVPYGRPSRPTIDTSGRTMSLTDTPRRDSASDMKRPGFDGRSSNPSSPVTGNAPFSPNGGGGGLRPSSRNRDREEDRQVKLPVFAPREGLPDMRSRSVEQGPRPQSPARGASPTPLPQTIRVTSPTPRSPNPVRVASPTPPPPRPQSPARGTRGVSPSGNIIPLGADTKNRTPSPLKEDPVESRRQSLSLPNTVRTPSPLHDIPEEKETQENQVRPPRTSSPVKPAPIEKDTSLVNLPIVPAQDSIRLVTPSPQPPPITQSVPSQPVTPQPEQKITLPSITPIAIPAPPEPEIDRNESPSPDLEWREDEDEQVSPADKRTTIFLQEASRKKDSLPPLPTELPPVPQLQRIISSNEPVNVDQKVASPLIPPPAAPALQSRLPGSGSDSSLGGSGMAKVTEDARKSTDSATSRPASITYPSPKQVKRNSSPAPVTYPTPIQPQSPKQPQRQSPAPSRSSPATPPQQSARPTHKKNASSGFSVFSWRSHPTSRASSERPRTPTANAMSASEGSLHSSPLHQLPELDVSRPITWGPLAFAAVSPSPGKGEDVPEVPAIPSRLIQHDWDKADVPQIPKESLKAGGQRDSRLDQPLHLGYEPPDLSLTRFTEESPAQSRRSSARPQGKAIAVKAMQPPGPLASELDDDLPAQNPDKGKSPQIEEEEQIHNTEAMSSDGHTDAESTFVRSKYLDRDITSFIASDHVIDHNNTSRPSTAKFANLPTLQIPPVPEERVFPAISTEMLPDFMSGRDIPEMPNVAQRIGAYQSRREQMMKADSGLRAWLLHVQTIRKPDPPQRITCFYLETDLLAPPEIARLSKESLTILTSPTAHVPFATGGGKVGRNMISKMKIGGRKISAAMEKISATTSQGEKRSSGDIPPARNTEKISPQQPMLSSPDYSIPIESPGRAQVEILQAELPRQNSVEYLTERMTPTPRTPVGLGLASVVTMESQPATTFSQMQIPEAPPSPVSYSRPETPVSPALSAQKKGHGSKSSVSGGKVSKFFGITVPSESKVKRNSAEDSPQPQQQSTTPSSPKPSKFPKLMNDLSSGSSKTNQQAAWTSSPVPPPPPDKSQFQKEPTTRGGGLKGFFADISSRDAAGNKPGEKYPAAQSTQTSPRPPKTSPRPNNGPPSSSGGGGFARFFSDISKRDLSGNTEEEKAAALAKKREQEGTHVPAQAAVYDESASDFEVKIGLMQDVLPHIRRDVLVASLKQAGGDERKGIGIAVLGNYGS